jgi:hypothetical protein
MPSTPNFGWPTPEDTAQVANGPAIIRALGDAIDSTIGDKNIPDFSDDTPADGQVLTFDQAQGVYVPEDPTAVAAGFQLAGTRTFTANGTFEKNNPFDDGNPDGLVLRAIRVRVAGGGGAAGGAGITGAGEVSMGAGGASGGFSESFITDIASLDSSVTVMVGAGGSGAVGVAGNDGTASSFGALVVADFGRGGLVRAPTSATTFILGPTGGDPGTGDLAFGGGAGFPGMGTPPTFAVAGNGGVNTFGGSGRGRTFNASGEAGTAPGAGGGGGANAQNQATARSGGAGADGIVIVECFV